MIINEIVQAIRKKRAEALHNYNREAKFAVYIDNETFDSMALELGTRQYPLAQLNPEPFIDGCPIYFVFGAGHGWKVYEVPT